MTDSKPMIGMFIPNPLDGTSFYRGHYPLSHLREKFQFNSLGPPPGVPMDYAGIEAAMCMHDAIFMQRPFRQEDLIIMSIAKRWGVPIWVDFDDLLTHVPMHNFAYLMYKDFRQLLPEIVAMADFVTVSTEFLRDFMVPEATVIKNALPASWYNPHFNCSRNSIAWRGSATHVRDVSLISMPMMKFAADHKEALFHVFGDQPWWMSLMQCDWQWHQPSHVGMFMESFKQTKPRTIVVPLVDDEFNRAKSNIAMLEATMAGTLCIASNLPEFEGSLLFKDAESFGKIMEVTYLSDSECKEAYAYQYAQSMKHTLEEENKKRLRILEELVKLGHKTGLYKEA